jgi:nicotinamide riboside transporter PnuC
MIELLGVIAGVIAVGGVVLNNYKLIGCFYLWFISNTISAIIHLHAGIWSMAARDVVFIMLAIHGIIVWKSKTKRKGLKA